MRRRLDGLQRGIVVGTTSVVFLLATLVLLVVLAILDGAGGSSDHPASRS